MAGLQDIWPMVSALIVNNKVSLPIRAAAKRSLDSSMTRARPQSHRIFGINKHVFLNFNLSGYVWSLIITFGLIQLATTYY